MKPFVVTKKLLNYAFLLILPLHNVRYAAYAFVSLSQIILPWNSETRVNKNTSKYRNQNAESFIWQSTTDDRFIWDVDIPGNEKGWVIGNAVCKIILFLIWYFHVSTFWYFHVTMFGNCTNKCILLHDNGANKEAIFAKYIILIIYYIILKCKSGKPANKNY